MGGCKYLIREEEEVQLAEMLMLLLPLILTRPLPAGCCFVIRGYK